MSGRREGWSFLGIYFLFISIKKCPNGRSPLYHKRARSYNHNHDTSAKICYDRSMKILVTGGTGYIGSHTVVELVQAGYEVEILDNLYNSKESVLDRIQEITGARPVFHKVDLLDFPGTLEVLRRGFDAVIHFAGLKAVAESVEKPVLYYENNISGTLNLLKAMRETRCRSLIFSSSATIV